MRWYHYVAYLFGDLFFTNVSPHFVNGAVGHPFQSPFAHPPGEELSSAMMSVVWGFFNVVVAYVLLGRLRAFACSGSASLRWV